MAIDGVSVTIKNHFLPLNAVTWEKAHVMFWGKSRLQNYIRIGSKEHKHTHQYTRVSRDSVKTAVHSPGRPPPCRCQCSSTGPWPRDTLEECHQARHGSRGLGDKHSVRDLKTGLQRCTKLETLGKQTKPALYFKNFYSAGLEIWDFLITAREIQSHLMINRM